MVSDLFTKKTPKNKNAPARISRGFTLFELLVCVAIFTLMTTVVLVKDNEFKGAVLTTNLAYEVALGVREAQVYGVDTNNYSTLSSLGTSAFSHAFGVHFDSPSGGTSLCSSGTSTSLVFCLFADVNDNRIYDPVAGSDVVLETDKISPGNAILDFCATASNVLYCSDGNATYPSASTVTSLTYMDITFKRPDPSADITTNVASTMTSATITVESNTGLTKTVDVSLVGQISVADE